MVVKKVAAAGAAKAADENKISWPRVSMTKKCPKTLIMECSRNVIDWDSLCQLTYETALARTTPSPHDCQTRHTSTPAQVSRNGARPCAFDPLPED